MPKTRFTLISLLVLLAVLLSACGGSRPVTASSELPLIGETFQTPVEPVKVLSAESSWLFGEHGVTADNTTAWTITATKDTYYPNNPEGGFMYVSCGECKLRLGDVVINAEGEPGLINLIFVRGPIDDGIVDSDRNLTGELYEFVEGHAIYAYLPKGARISLNWTLDQITAATTESFTACGGLGCSRARIHAYDTDSNLYQQYMLSADNIEAWVLIMSNAK